MSYEEISNSWDNVTRNRINEVIKGMNRGSINVAPNSITEEKITDEAITNKKKTSLGEFGFLNSRLPVNINTVSRKIEFPNSEEIFLTYRTWNQKISDSVKNTSINMNEDGFLFFNTKTFILKASSSLPTDSENYIILGFIYWNQKTYMLNGNFSVDGKKKPTIGEYGFITSDKPININTVKKTLEFPDTNVIYATYRGENIPIATTYKNTSLDISFAGANAGFLYFDTNTFQIYASVSLPSDHGSYIILGYIFLYSNVINLNMNYTIDGFTIKNELENLSNEFNSKMNKLENGVISKISASASGPRSNTFILQTIYDIGNLSSGDAFKYEINLTNYDENLKEVYCLFYTNDSSNLAATDGLLNESSRHSVVSGTKTYEFNGECGNNGRYLHVFICFGIVDGTKKTNLTVNSFPKITYKNTVYEYDTFLSNINFYASSAGDNIETTDERMVKNYFLEEKVSLFTNNPLYGEKYNALGDSLVYGHTLGPAITFSSLIGQRNKMTIRNYGVNGTLLSGNDVNSMVNRYVNMDNDAKYITVLGGTNDYFYINNIGSNSDFTKDTFKGSLNILCKGLIEKYPTAKIGFLTPFHFTDDPNNNGIKLIEIVDAIIEICSLFSIPVLDNYRTGTLLPINETQKAALMMDGLHPNVDGHKHISTRIESFLKSL